MKRSVIILAALIFVGLLTVLVVWFLAARKSNPPPPNPGTVFPGGQNGVSVSLTETQIQALLTRPDTKEDEVNPGYYYVGNQPGQEVPYLVEYLKETDYFNIVLLQEPLRESRAAAENYLMQALGDTKKETCALHYTLSVPNSVNSSYAGINLGFSFCPGATKLP